jgi:hypothetical protein
MSCAPRMFRESDHFFFKNISGNATDVSRCSARCNQTDACPTGIASQLLCWN